MDTGTVVDGKANVTITGLTGTANKEVGALALPLLPRVHRRPAPPPTPSPRQRRSPFSPTEHSCFAAHPRRRCQPVRHRQLDAQATAQLQIADPRIAAHVMAQGSLTSARNPSAPPLLPDTPPLGSTSLLSTAARPPPSPCPPSPSHQPSPTPAVKGSLARAVRASDAAATRHVLIAHPDAIYDVDRRGSTALHLAAGAGFATLAVLLLAARSDVNARDRDGYTPAPRRADFAHAADPAASVDVHRCLADEARRSSRCVPWTDEPWASLGASRTQGAPPHANRPRPLADRAPAPHLAPTRPTALAVTPSTTAQAPLVVAACTINTTPHSTANDAPDAPIPIVGLLTNAPVHGAPFRRSPITPISPRCPLSPPRRRP